MPSYEAPKTWDPQAVKQAIDLELEFGSPYSPASDSDLSTSSSAKDRVTTEGLTRKKAREAAPVAMDSIIYLATYSENESLRFKAATYLVDRVLGKVTDVPMDNSELDETDPLTRLVKSSLGVAHGEN